jgi:integrase
VAIFRKYKTVEELIPGFILEKEMVVSNKSLSPYTHQTAVFLEWLKDHNYSHLSIRKITSEMITNFFYFIGNKKRFGNRACSINMLRWRFNKVRDRLNLSKGYKFYSFKHTGASRLHQSGISMRELMDQLRHTKLEATQHYVKKHIGIRNDRVRDNFPSPI